VCEESVEDLRSIVTLVQDAMTAAVFKLRWVRWIAVKRCQRVELLG
jgi:hypothetical protein